MKILMIAPACYPVNGPEAIVNMKLLQAFSRAGDISVDLISRNFSYIYPSEGIDKYGVKVNELHLVEYVPHKNIATLWRYFLSFFYFHIVFFESIWAVETLRVIKKLVKENKYDYVLTKNAPSFLLGAYLKSKGVKWVASWNDPYPGSFYPYPYGLGKNNKGTHHERRIIKKMRMADFHIFPSYLLQEHMRTYLRAPIGKCKVIPHVVLENIIQVRRIQEKSENNEVLRIIHSGNLYGQRNPLCFFRAVENLLKSDPSIKINITILGRLDDKYLPELEKLPLLKNSVFFLKPVEYQQSLVLLDSYDVACVLEAPCRKGEAVFLPTKVSDFMQQGIPIMALSPLDGVLHGMYKKGNIGYYGDVTDVKSIEVAINSLYKDFKENKLKSNVIDDSFLSTSVVESYREVADYLKTC